MPISKTAITALLLAGVACLPGCRKDSPPPTPKAAAPAVAPAASPAPAPEAAPVDDDSIVLKEDFETLDKGKWPAGWEGWESSRSRKMKIMEEGKRHFLELAATTDVFRMRLSRTIPCSQKYTAYDFSVRARVKDMNEPHGYIRGATLGVDWLDAAGKVIGESDTDYLTEAGNWRLLEAVYQAPTNAVSMKIFPALIRCGGTVDFEDIIVKGVDVPQEKVVYQENFDKAATPDQVKSWQWDPLGPDESLAIKDESGTHFLEFKGSAVDGLKHIGWLEIPLDPGWSRIRFSAQARGRDLNTGSTQGAIGLLVLGYWADESRNNVTPYRMQTDSVHNNDFWKRLDVARDIPTGAKNLELNLVFISASGSVDITDIKVAVVQ